MTFPCPRCDGQGTVIITPPNSPSRAVYRPCEECDATGLILCEYEISAEILCGDSAEVKHSSDYFCTAHAKLIEAYDE